MSVLIKPILRGSGQGFFDRPIAAPSRIQQVFTNAESSRPLSNTQCFTLKRPQYYSTSVSVLLLDCAPSTVSRPVTFQTLFTVSARIMPVAIDAIKRSVRRTHSHIFYKTMQSALYQIPEPPSNAYGNLTLLVHSLMNGVSRSIATMNHRLVRAVGRRSTQMMLANTAIATTALSASVAQARAIYRFFYATCTLTPPKQFPFGTVRKTQNCPFTDNPTSHINRADAVQRGFMNNRISTASAAFRLTACQQSASGNAAHTAVAFNEPIALFAIVPSIIQNTPSPKAFARQVTHLPVHRRDRIGWCKSAEVGRINVSHIKSQLLFVWSGLGERIRAFSSRFHNNYITSEVQYA